jgi:hypothetical protein
VANDKIIIPQNNFSIIAEYEDNLIKETGKIDVPYSSRTVFLKNRLIVSLCFGSKPKSRSLKIFDEYGNPLLRKTGYKFKSINFKDTVVYLGGQYRNKRNELFSYSDFNGVVFKMNEIDLPVKTIEGKSIDDILIRNKTLFLVDNVVYPKYIFKYDINIPNNPKHIGTYKLENNGTYEHIIKGDINDNWIILFSSTVGMGGAYQHISIIGKEEKCNEQNVLTFYVEKPCFSEFYHLGTSPRILDICIIKDVLLILKQNGLYFINLTNKITKENIMQINDNKEKYNKLLRINNECCIILNGEKYKLLIELFRNFSF